MGHSCYDLTTSAAMIGVALYARYPTASEMRPSGTSAGRSAPSHQL